MSVSETLEFAARGLSTAAGKRRVSRCCWKELNELDERTESGGKFQIVEAAARKLNTEN